MTNVFVKGIIPIEGDDDDTQDGDGADDADDLSYDDASGSDTDLGDSSH